MIKQRDSLKYKDPNGIVIERDRNITCYSYIFFINMFKKSLLHFILTITRYFIRILNATFLLLTQINREYQGKVTDLSI